MKKFLSSLIGIVIVCGIIAAALLPNPFLTNSLTKTHWQKVNDFYEIEETSFSSPQNKDTLLINWDTANNLWSLFSDVEILDLLTQKTFTSQRTGGNFHADIEPATTEDTEILKQIIASSNLARRPVLVHLGTLWASASMSTKVTGFGLITNNNLNGHICVHFQESKTSGTKKVDPLHQKTILKAFRMSKKIPF